jgi:ATP-dependent helicase HrpA
MRSGVRRLFMLQVGREMKHLARHLPGIDRMCMEYAPAGPCDELRRDLLNVIVDRAMYDDAPPDAPPVRTQQEFAALAESGWRRLSAASQEVTDLVSQILTTWHDLNRQLAGNFPPVLAPSIADMREQLAHLVHRGFVVATPWPWLRNYPRFLKGIDLRIRKLLNAGAVRDGLAMTDIRPLWESYLRRVAQHREQDTTDPALQQFRWMLEELRVSLFAQELKTSVPVSVKRLQGLWAEVKT